MRVFGVFLTWSLPRSSCASGGFPNANITKIGGYLGV